jgi:hypothetical protein
MEASLLDAAPPSSSTRHALFERVWIVSLFSVFAFLQGMCWAIPGPLSSAYLTLYGADGSLVQLFVNLGPIVYAAPKHQRAP